MLFMKKTKGGKQGGFMVFLFYVSMLKNIFCDFYEHLKGGNDGV